MTLTSQVATFLRKRPDASFKDIRKVFPDTSYGYIKKLYYQERKVTPKEVTSYPEVTNDELTAKLGNFKLSSNITLDKIEKLIIEGKTPIPVLRVMLDLLKVKQQDQSELKEIDLDKFYKIGIDD